ncbi:MAG: hypothetical protein WBB82_15370 [Limnothrix sp.]
MLFGFITEGATDQAVLKNILYGLFDTDDIDFTSLAPLLDETGKSTVKTRAGWQRALEFCSSAKFEDTLAFVDYLIIQIDTDVSEEKGFDICHTYFDEQNQRHEEKNTEQLILEVVEFLKKKISLDIYRDYKDQIIFAVSVHSIECWLLPILFPSDSPTDQKKRQKRKNCFNSITTRLKKSSIKTCDPELDLWIKKAKQPIVKDKKETEVYRQLSNPFVKRLLLFQAIPKNESLCHFISYLLEAIEEKDFDPEMSKLRNEIELQFQELPKSLEED